MALVQVARYYTLSEAHVAASVLQSAGIAASIADAHYGSVFWLEQSALGGYRLSVASEDLPDAVEILSSPPPPDLADEAPDDPLPTSQRVVAGALMVTMGPAAAWLATKRWKRSSPIDDPAAGISVRFQVALVVAAAVLGVYFVAELLTNPP